jgi:hypothetical protein
MMMKEIYALEVNKIVARSFRKADIKDRAPLEA